MVRTTVIVLWCLTKDQHAPAAKATIATALDINNWFQSPSQVCRFMNSVCGTAVVTDFAMVSPLPVCHDDADHTAALVQADELHAVAHDESLVGILAVALHVDADVAPGARS